MKRCILLDISAARFCTEVRKRPVLYNHTVILTEYQDDQMWAPISQLFALTVAECKSRWVKIRKDYARWLKNDAHKPIADRSRPFVLSQVLMFLKPYITDEEGADSDDDDKDDDDAAEEGEGKEDDAVEQQRNFNVERLLFKDHLRRRFSVDTMNRSKGSQLTQSPQSQPELEQEEEEEATPKEFFIKRNDGTDRLVIGSRKKSQTPDPLDEPPSPPQGRAKRGRPSKRGGITKPAIGTRRTSRRTTVQSIGASEIVQSIYPPPKMTPVPKAKKQPQQQQKQKTTATKIATDPLQTTTTPMEDSLVMPPPPPPPQQQQAAASPLRPITRRSPSPRISPARSIVTPSPIEFPSSPTPGNKSPSPPQPPTSSAAQPPPPAAVEKPSQSEENQKEFIDNSTQFECQDYCSDTHFLDTIGPQMRVMNSRQKLMFKKKVFQALMETFDDATDFPNAGDVQHFNINTPSGHEHLNDREFHLVRELVSIVSASKFSKLPATASDGKTNGNSIGNTSGGELRIGGGSGVGVGVGAGNVQRVYRQMNGPMRHHLQQQLSGVSLGIDGGGGEKRVTPNMRVVTGPLSAHRITSLGSRTATLDRIGTLTLPSQQQQQHQQQHLSSPTVVGATMVNNQEKVTTTATTIASSTPVVAMTPPQVPPQQAQAIATPLSMFFGAPHAVTATVPASTIVTTRPMATRRYSVCGSSAPNSGGGGGIVTPGLKEAENLKLLKRSLTNSGFSQSSMAPPPAQRGRYNSKGGNTNTNKVLPTTNSTGGSTMIGNGGAKKLMTSLSPGQKPAVKVAMQSNGASYLNKNSITNPQILSMTVPPASSLAAPVTSSASSSPGKGKSTLVIAQPKQPQMATTNKPSMSTVLKRNLVVAQPKQMATIATSTSPASLLEREARLKILEENQKKRRMQAMQQTAGTIAADDFSMPFLKREPQDDTDNILGM